VSRVTDAPTWRSGGRRRAHGLGQRSAWQARRLDQQRRHRPISKLDQLRVEDWEAMVDINVKGLLYGIAAALPIFRRQGFGHFVNTISTAGIQISPTMAVYAATKNAVRTLSEGLRLESDGKYRVTGISPGFVGTNFAESMTDPGVRAEFRSRWTRSRWSQRRSPARWRSRSSSPTMSMSATSSFDPRSRAELLLGSVSRGPTSY
jgi:short-subunit dehydrogenase